jgi:HEPN domain-containing protein
MPDDRQQRPDDPEAWIALANQDLILTRSRPPGVGFGLLTYHAQQAAEKAVKAVLLAHSVPFRRIDNAPETA